MKTFVLRADVIECAASRSCNSGDGMITGSLFGVSINTTASSATGQFLVRGVADIPKDASAVTLGMKMYWDNAAFKVTATATANTLIGVATQAQNSGDATARVLLGAV